MISRQYFNTVTGAKEKTYTRIAHRVGEKRNKKHDTYLCPVQIQNSSMTTDPQVINYPVYRKYTDGRVYFKILSPTEFEEARRTPRGREFETHRAKLLPDRQLIVDMIDMRGGFWLEVSHEEYESLKS